MGNENIIVKKEKGETKILIAEKLLINKTGISINYLRKCRSQEKKCYTTTTINEKIYYNYLSIPNRKPNNYRDKIGKIEDLIKQQKQTENPEKIDIKNHYKEIVEKKKNNKNPKTSQTMPAK